MADQDIDKQLMSIISGKLMFDPTYNKYKIDDDGNLLVDADGIPLPPSEILKKLTEEEKEILIKEAEEAKKIINDDNASFMKKLPSFSDVKGKVTAGLTDIGTAASGVLGNFPFGSKKPEEVEGGKRKSRKQKKSKKSKKNKSKKSKK